MVTNMILLTIKIIVNRLNSFILTAANGKYLLSYINTLNIKKTKYIVTFHRSMRNSLPQSSSLILEKERSLRILKY